MPIETIAAIEARYGLIIPELYREMWMYGKLEPGDEYLDLWECNWRLIDEVLENQHFTYPNPRGGGELVHKPGYVTFGLTGGGDRWSWWPEAVHEGGVPVVYCPASPVAGKARVYSPDFQGFIYRVMLDFVCEGFGGDISAEVETEARAYLQKSMRILPQIPAKWAATVTEISGRHLVRRMRKSPIIGEPDVPWSGLLEIDERAAILRRDMPFVEIDHEFNCFL